MNFFVSKTQSEKVIFIVKKLFGQLQIVSYWISCIDVYFKSKIQGD